MEPSGTIGVEGEWELLAADGSPIDRQQEPDARYGYRIHHLLLHDVTGFHVSAPDWFSLTFDNGMVLKIYDASSDYESFSIQPGNIYV